MSFTLRPVVRFSQDVRPILINAFGTCSQFWVSNDAKYIAVDQDGEIQQFSKKPQINDFFWESSPGEHIETRFIGSFEGHVYYLKNHWNTYLYEIDGKDEIMISAPTHGIVFGYLTNHVKIRTSFGEWEFDLPKSVERVSLLKSGLIGEVVGSSFNMIMQLPKPAEGLNYVKQSFLVSDQDTITFDTETFDESSQA